MMDFISADLAINTEEDILSCILLSPEAIEKAKMLRPEAFSQTAHQLIFRAMVRLHERGGITDLLSVTSYLHSEKNLINVGGQKKLAELLDRQVPIALLDTRIKMVEQQYKHRRLRKIQANLTSPEAIPDAIAELQALQSNQVGISDNPDERLRLEIAVYMKETDVVRKKWLRGKICSTFRISKEDIREIEQELERAQTKPRKRSYSFDEFLSEETEALRWIIPGLLPAGETILLAAQAKCGKTALVTDIIHAVVSGEGAIGQQVGVKGRVLFVSSDESKNTTRRRVIARGIDLQSERENLRFMPYLDINKLGELEAELEDFRPKLVVIDSLTTITEELGISEKDPEFARYLYKLKELLGRYGAAGIVTHHENKDPLAKGLNKVSGSARIPAAVWGIWQLSAIDPNNDKDPRRWLKVKPREGEATTLSLEMNPKDLWASRGIFEFLGELGDESGEKRSQGERVLELLRKYSPKGLEYQEIDQALQIGRSLYTILDRLEDKQLVTKRRSETNPRKWVYAVPCDEDDDVKKGNCHKGDSPPPSVDQTSPFLSSEITDTQGLESIQQEFNKYSTSIQQTSAEKEVLNSCNPELVSDSVAIQQNQQIRGGEGVSNPVESQLSHPLKGLPQFGGSLGLTRVCDEVPAAEQISLPIGQRSDGEIVLTLPVFKKGDRVLTPEGEGTVDRYDEYFQQYNVWFDASTGYFSAQELRLIE